MAQHLDRDGTPSPDTNGGDLLLVTGQPYIPQLGLHRFGARWYSPDLGRFISPDPAGDVDGLNRYAYVGNMPYSFVDPTGMWRAGLERFVDRATARYLVGIPAGLVGMPPPPIRADLEGEMLNGMLVGNSVGLTGSFAGQVVGAGMIDGGVAAATTGVFAPEGVPVAVVGVAVMASSTAVQGRLLEARAEVQNALNRVEAGASTSGGSASKAGLTKSPHAISRGAQGRQIQTAAGDVQRARRADVFRQPSDGRLVVRGSNGREHIIEPNGELVTTINQRTRRAHRQRLQNGAIEPATEAEFDFLKGLVE